MSGSGGYWGELGASPLVGSAYALTYDLGVVAYSTMLFEEPPQLVEDGYAAATSFGNEDLYQTRVSEEALACAVNRSAHNLYVSRNGSNNAFNLGGAPAVGTNPQVLLWQMS